MTQKQCLSSDGLAVGAEVNVSLLFSQACLLLRIE